MRYYHFFIVEIIVESVNLIQMSQENRKLYHHDGEQLRIENYYHHDGEQLGFYENVHIKTQNKKKNVLVVFILHEMKICSKNTDESLDECRRV